MVKPAKNTVDESSGGEEDDRRDGGGLGQMVGWEEFDVVRREKIVSIFHETQRLEIEIASIKSSRLHSSGSNLAPGRLVSGGNEFLIFTNLKD
ncbi:hypothetical protein R6Q59_014043 [Mikania micrantha]